MTEINEASPEYQQYVLRVAEQNAVKGIIEEPRIYFDTITLGDPYLEVNCHPGTFQNGEQFPVRITHITMALARLNDEDEEVDPLLLQKVGLRLKYHDQFYMNEYSDNPFAGSRKLFTTIPAWAQRPTASAPSISEATSVFAHRPFILSARDAMRVDVRLDEADSDDVFTVAVGMNGIGALSRRPYFLHGSIYVADTTKQTLSPANFKNDGSEPIIVTNTTISCGAEISSADPTGNIARITGVGFKQIGNGTGRSWVVGPTTDPLIMSDLAPAISLGNLTGRAVVHRLPGDGLLWAPGDGIQAFVQNQDPSGDLDGAKVNIALLGYIAVT